MRQPIGTRAPSQESTLAVERKGPVASRHASVFRIGIILVTAIAIAIAAAPALARSDPDPAALARTHLQAAKDHARRGRWPESLVRAVQAHAAQPANAPAELAISITLARAAALQQTERTQAAMQLLLPARAAARNSGLTELEGRALLQMSSALGRQGDLDRAERAIDEGLAIARAIDAQGLVVRFLLNLGRVQLARGQVGQSARTIGEASVLPVPAEEAEELEQALLVARLAVAEKGSDRGEAVRLATNAVDRATQLGFRQLEAYASEMAGRRLCEQGRHEDGIRFVLRALSIFPELDAPRDQSRALTALAGCHLARGDARQVHAALTEAITMRDRAHERSRTDTDAAAEALYENQRVRSDLAAAQAESSRIAERLATASAKTAWALLTLGLALAVVLALLVANRWARTSVRFEKRLADDRARSFARTSHEIRNPAQALTGLLGAAARDADPDRRAALLAAAERAAWVIADLARCYQDIASPPAGGAKAPVTEAHGRTENISRVLEDAVRLAEHLPGESRQSIVLTIAPAVDQAWLRIDATALTQSLLNLLSNARRYAGPSEIRVLAGRTDSGDLSIMVEDDGPGLKTDELTRLFEPGVRGTAAGVWPGGDGLGLAISREILTRCGGQLHADASMTTGARFEIRLPWREAPPPGHRADVRSGALRVLVVDDDPVVLAALTAQLESIGCSVCADSGSTGVEQLLSTVDPHVVVLDRHIGSVSGVGIASRIRQWDRVAGLHRRVVMLSGAVERSDEISTHLDAVASKPISSEALARLVVPRTADSTTPCVATQNPNQDGIATTMPPETSASPRVDHEIVSRLKQLEATRPGLLARLLDTFSTNQRRFVDDLATIATGGETKERIRIGAHSLKGSAASLGASRLSQLAGQLEAAIIGGDPAEIMVQATRVSAELEPSIAALHAVLADKN